MLVLTFSRLNQEWLTGLYGYTRFLNFTRLLKVNGLNLPETRFKPVAMKASCLKFLFVAAIALTLSACEKNVENVKNVSEVKAAVTSDVVYPLVGTDTSNHILPRRKLPKAVLKYGTLEEEYPDLKVQVIDTVCADYLNGTEKFDLSYLAEGSVTYVVRKADNVLTGDPDFFNGGFKKLSNGPNGWWTHWNYSPYTESDAPIVLFALNRRETAVYPMNTMSISLRNAVKTFGFEIAPNTTGKDMEVIVSYQSGGSYRFPDMFEVHQTVSSPSGARLIAVKSNHAFDYVNIQLRGDVPFRDKGFAIANIRFQLAN
jgi:hypothetical protein